MGLGSVTGLQRPAQSPQLGTLGGMPVEKGDGLDCLKG